MKMTKVIRKIIKIDEELCTGCGNCIPGCAEQALQLVDTPNGKKARMVKEIYCDGLGACLGDCPTGALSIEEREADPFSEEAAMEHAKEVTPEIIEDHKKSADQPASDEASHLSSVIKPPSGGCPSSRVLQWDSSDTSSNDTTRIGSQLRQWPVQLHLVPPNAPYFEDADIVFVADCVPIAYPNFHQDFLKNKAIAIFCPMLDNTESYTPKIASIIKTAQPKSIQVVHMSVGCCFGLKLIVEDAVKQAGTNIQVEEVIIDIKGNKRVVNTAV